MPPATNKTGGMIVIYFRRASSELSSEPLQRWRWDLNPRRSFPLTRVRDVVLRPLGHATAAESSQRWQLPLGRRLGLNHAVAHVLQVAKVVADATTLGWTKIPSHPGARLGHRGPHDFGARAVGRGRRPAVPHSPQRQHSNDEPVSDEQLRAVHDLVQYGPTALNVQPLRVLLPRGLGPTRRAHGLQQQGQDRRRPAGRGPWRRPRHPLPTVFAHFPGAKDTYAAEAGRHAPGRDNAWLPAGCFIVDVRATGLAAGPMGGFDRNSCLLYDQVVTTV